MVCFKGELVLRDTLRLLNKYEEIVFDRLVEKCNQDVHVFAKVRLADVFLIKNSGLSDESFSYSLKSHFDFTVFDKDYQPLFSVEYDGKQHKTDKTQIKNDELKNEICDYFNYPILRINSNYINKQYKGIDLLSYFIDAWFLSEAFAEAQESGGIPYEEDFDMCFIASNGGETKWPYWLSADLQIEIQNLYKARKINQFAPSHWIGKDENNNYRCICWVEIKPSIIVAIKTGMKMQRFPIRIESDLLWMLAVFDIYKEIEAYLEGRIQGTSIDVFKEQLKSFCKPLEGCSSGTCGSISEPIF